LRTKYRLEKLNGTKPLVRPVRWWENNIKIDLTEVECDNVNWIEL